MPEQSSDIEKSKDRTKAGSKRNLLNMPIRSAVFMLALPTMGAGILENIATTIDLFMVGRLGPAEVAAVGTSGMVYWVVSALAIGLSVSAMAVIARSYGGGKREEASQALGQTLTLAAIVSVFVAMITIVLAPSILGLFGMEPDVEALSVSYLRILSVGMVFFAVVAVSSGGLRGAGDTVTPLIVGFLANIVHIVLNYLFIFGKFGLPKMGSDGAALGTAISMVVAAAVYLFLHFKKRVAIVLKWGDFGLDINRAKQLIRLGVPAAAEQIILQLGLLVYVWFVVGYGTLALAGYQVGMRVLSLSFIPNMGFSTAAGAIIGQNLGAERKREAKQAGWVCLWWGMGFMCLIGLMFLLFSRQLAGFFVDDPEVIEHAAEFIRIVAYCQPGMAIYFTLSGALRGAGDTRSPLLIAFVGMYFFRIPGAWILTEKFDVGLFAIFALLIGDYIIRIILILLRYARGRWLATKV
jgi:putative MATE family efflux protein